MSVRLLAITMFFIWFIKLAQKYIFFALHYCVCIFSFDSVYSYDNVWLKMYIKLMTNKPQICHKIYVPECVCVSWMLVTCRSQLYRIYIHVCRNVLDLDFIWNGLMLMPIWFDRFTEIELYMWLATGLNSLRCCHLHMESNFV